MKKVSAHLFLILILTFGLSLSVLGQETITLTTFYPSPVGVYDRLVTNTLGVGDQDDPADGLDISDAPDPATNPGDVWIAGNLGIRTGTTGPVNRLDVAGGAVIGSGYAGVNTAPTDGLLVEGDMGIGTATVTAGSVLDIQGGNVTIGAYTLPNVDGSADQVLTTNGLGTVSWQDSSGNFGGMFTDGMFVFYVCQAVNPLTGGCSCPDGFTEYLGGSVFINVVWWYNIYYCMK